MLLWNYLFIAFQHDRRIVTAKPEGCGHCRIHLDVAGLSREIEVVVDGFARVAVDLVVLDGFGADGDFDGAAGSQRMADEALGGADGRLCFLRSEHVVDHGRFRRIVELGSCAVGVVVIHLLIAHQTLHHLRNDRSILRHGNDAVTVAGALKTGNFGVDLSAPRPGVLQFL